MIGLLPTSRQTTTEVRQQCNMIFEVLEENRCLRIALSSIQGKIKTFLHKRDGRVCHQQT